MVIGIIGGGQLGMFLAKSSYNMGYKTFVYDQNEDCCARSVSTYFMQGDFDDEKKLEDFCMKCDVITYEFENINNIIIDKLSSKYNIVQKSHPLKLASSRINERSLASSLDILQPKWEQVEDVNKINIDYPYILKSDSLGYDGKNQYHINKESDLNDVDLSVKYIAEERIDFDYEISVIACRSLNGEYQYYEPFYNIHKNGILHITLINQDINPHIVNQAYIIIKKIMDSKDIYGILCCEMFVKGDCVYFNEMAPRPHNSGHITMDCHHFSQYDNHIRSILGMKLGLTNIKCEAFMVNVLGQDIEKVEVVLDSYRDKIKYYNYHKSPKFNRKIGHLIVFDLSLLEYFKENW